MLSYRWTHIVLGGFDGTGCPGLPDEVGGAVLVHQEPRAHRLHGADHKQSHVSDTCETFSANKLCSTLLSKLHTRLTTDPLEQTRWMRVVYESLWPSDMQTEPSVNSSSSRSRPSMIGPRLEIPMLLTDTTSFRESEWEETAPNSHLRHNTVWIHG